MNKKIDFSQPNKTTKKRLADSWVEMGSESVKKKSSKRLTIDIPIDLHTAIKVFCAKKGVKINEEIIPILQKYFE